MIRRLCLPRRTVVTVTSRGTQRLGRGLKKDESSYMLSPEGIPYPGPSDMRRPVHDILGEKWALPEELLVQSLTHKSFAHAKCPYNEKLAILGQQLLRMEASRAVADYYPQDTMSENYLLNGKNFDVDQRAVELLSSTPTLSALCRQAGLNGAIFWKPARPGDAPTVQAKVVCALVGAVLTRHGLESASAFIHEKLFQGPLSVFKVADQLYRP